MRRFVRQPATARHPMPEQVIFLPGASGNTHFWRPVAQRLRPGPRHLHIAYPGFGPTAAEPGIRHLDDLVTRVVQQIDRPTALVAQSMGCVLAVLALAQRPQHLTHLVLTALSGGLDLAALGAEDWRPAQGRTSNLFAAFDGDLRPALREVRVPTLLLWGDQDPLSPVAVGEHLTSLIPHARLVVVPGGDHTFANTHAAHVAPLVDAHLAAQSHFGEPAGSPVSRPTTPPSPR